MPKVKPFTRYFDRADGGRLRAQQWGAESGTVVVFLHGGGQNRHAWRSSAERFAELGFTAITVDQRGHGDSERTRTEAYRPEEMADDVIRLCRALKTRPVLVGASMGGILSLIAEGELAPGVCRALVLVDVTPEVVPDGIGRVHDFFDVSAEGFTTIDDGHATLRKFAVHRRHTRASTERNLELGPDGRWYWHWDPLFASTVRSFHDPDRLQRALKRVQVPVLVVRGEHSDIVPVAAIASLPRLNPQIEVREVSGAGHMITAEHNDAFAEVIFTFLRRHNLELKEIKT